MPRKDTTPPNHSQKLSKPHSTVLSHWEHYSGFRTLVPHDWQRTPDPHGGHFTINYMTTGSIMLVMSTLMLIISSIIMLPTVSSC